MKNIIITTSSILLFSYFLVQEMNTLKNTSAELSSHIQILKENNNKINKILEKDPFLVNKGDYLVFSFDDIIKRKNNLKIEKLEEIEKEAKIAEDYILSNYKDLDLENIDQEELKNIKTSINEELKNNNINIIIE